MPPARQVVAPGRGRDASCPAPPARIRTCGVTASAPVESHGTDYRDLGRPCSSGTGDDGACETLVQYCARGVVCRHQLPATGRLPPPPPRPARPALFGASQVHAGRPTPRLFAAASPSRLPAVARDRQRRLWARPGLAASNAFAGMANDLLIFRPSLSQPLSPGATRESVSGAPGEHPVSRFISAGRAFN